MKTQSLSSISCSTFDEILDSQSVLIRMSDIGCSRPLAIS